MSLQVLFKMDRSGDCQEIAVADLGLNRDLNFVGFTPDMFLQVCTSRPLKLGSL